ncbi:MAG: hypothetical protein PSN34_16040 [Urechidicola sp.]|nr:hypothetical protein [Urechidicola sp.]
MKNTFTILFLVFIINNVFCQNTTTNSTKYRDEYKNKGYFNITKLAYIKMSSIKQELFIEGEGNIFSDLKTEGAYAWSIQTINGYFISPNFSLGIGLGLDGYHDPNYNTLPVFFDIRVYLSDKEDSFYSYFDIGPTIKLGGDNSQFRKGAMFNIGLGYKFNVTNNIFLISDIFYSHKTISLTNERIGTSDNIIKSNGIGLSLGVIF